MPWRDVLQLPDDLSLSRWRSSMASHGVVIWKFFYTAMVRFVGAEFEMNRFLSGTLRLVECVIYVSTTGWNVVRLFFCENPDDELVEILFLCSW